MREGREWVRNGTTSTCNICYLCRHHHRLKDQPGWKFVFTATPAHSPSPPPGRQHTTQPERLIDPHLEPPDGTPPKNLPTQQGSQIERDRNKACPARTVQMA